jgi:hypothetical protein
MWILGYTLCHPYATEQDTLPVASLISKQVVSYQTHGGTGYFEGFTPKNQSLVDLSKTNHITGRT